MRTLARLVAAVGYTFAAWAAAALIVYAGSRLQPRPLLIAYRCAAVACAFSSVFSLYFRRGDRLPPAAAAAVALAFLVGLDTALLGPYFLHATDFMRSFWDWQLPAAIVAATVSGTGWLARKPARADIQNV